MKNLLSSIAEQKAIEAISLSFCQGLNLSEIKRQVGNLLSHIGDNGIFSEFTMHDITHVDGMLALTDKVIDDKTRATMTQADWLMIVLAIYFHDLGMFVTQDEYDNRFSDTDFCEFQQRMENDSKISADLQTLLQEKKDHFLYQEYVRRNHGERIYEIIAECEKFDKEPYNTVNQILKPLSADFRKDLAAVCQSHVQDELDEHLKITDVAHGSSPQEKVNLLYACVVLRTADLLHVTYERTPKDEFRIISPKNEVSVIEWIKQLSVKSIDIHKECDEEGNVDNSIPVHSFEVQARFTDDRGYFSFLEYINYAKSELKKCHKWCEESRKKNATDYYFPWDNINTDRIEAVGFDKKKLNFVVDQQNILKLLTGHTLYNDSTVVLRELIQNSIDAGKLQSATEKANSKYKSKIVIKWDSHIRKLTISDNATGMTNSDIKEYLLKVGASKYQSEIFKNDYPDFNSVSRFGIGLLTCFMISDNIDIYTLSADDKRCLLLKIRNLNGEYLMRYDAETSFILEEKHGTTFELYVRSDVNMENIAEQIKKWIILPESEIYLEVQDRCEKINIGYTNSSIALQEYISKEYDVNFDNENYRVRTLIDDTMGVSLSCVQKKNIFTKIWSPYVIPSGHEFSDNAPVGICVEGIRVTQSLPGLEGQNIPMLINCAGKNAPTTNVARDAIEEGPALKNMLKTVYQMYFKLFMEQKSDLLENNSELWVHRELNYEIGKFMKYNLHVDTKNQNIVNDILSKIPVYMLDDKNNLQACNIYHLPDKLCTIDSVSFSYALRFFQDLPIQSEFATPICILQNLTGKKYAEKSFFYDEDLFLEALKIYREFYFPNSIIVSPQERKVSIEWQRGENPWFYFPVEKRFYSSQNSIRALYIQKSEESINLQGINQSKIICSYDKIFIMNGCPIHNTLTKYLGELKKNQHVFANVLSWICENIRIGIVDAMYGVSYLYESIDFINEDELDEKKIPLKEIESAIKESASLILDYSRYYHSYDNE